MTEEARQYAPECYACPIGTVSMKLQEAAPDAGEHLIRAGRELLQVANSLIQSFDAFLGMMEERGGGKRATVESIPIRRQTIRRDDS